MLAQIKKKKKDMGVGVMRIFYLKGTEFQFCKMERVL